MQVLTLEEAKTFCKSCGFEASQEELTLANRVLHTHSAWLDQHSRKIAIFARTVARLVEKSSALLWITEYGIWPTEENNTIFLKLLGAFGEPRPHWEAPGYLFDPSEREELQGFLRLALIFGWGGHVVCKSPQVAFFFSHDEFVRILTSDDPVYDTWLKAVSEFEPSA